MAEQKEVKVPRVYLLLGPEDNNWPSFIDEEGFKQFFDKLYDNTVRLKQNLTGHPGCKKPSPCNCGRLDS